MQVDGPSMDRFSVGLVQNVHDGITYFKLSRLREAFFELRRAIEKFRRRSVMITHLELKDSTLDLKIENNVTGVILIKVQYTSNLWECQYFFSSSGKDLKVCDGEPNINYHAHLELYHSNVLPLTQCIQFQ